MTITRPDAPLFVVGCPRSGTTLLRLMLTSHSQICIPPESSFIINLLPRWGDTILHSKEDVDAFLSALSSDKKFGEWGVPQEKLRASLCANLPLNYRQTIEYVYASYLQHTKPSASIWGDKNPGYIYHLETLERLFPTAKFIHILRDGRAVFSSGLNANARKSAKGLAKKFPTNAYISYRTWHTALDSVVRQQDELTLLTVRYEELVSSPQATLQKMCQFLDVSFESNMLDYPQRNRDEQLVPRHRLTWHRKTLCAPDSSRKEGWRQELPQKKLLQYEALAHKDLKKWGYPISLTRQHLLAHDGRLLLWQGQRLLTLLYDRLPTNWQRSLRSVRRELGYTRDVRIPVILRSLRESAASLRPAEPTAQAGISVAYIIGLPRTGTSLAKNYLGDYPRLHVMPFQKRGFTMAWSQAERTDGIVVDKATHYIRSIHKLWRAYGPNVAICCLVRDPRDELLSLLEAPFHLEMHRDKRFWAQWVSAYGDYLSLVEHVANPERLCLLRYEDLVRHPRQVKIQFLRWLGLQVDTYAVTDEYTLAHENDTQDWKVAERRTVVPASIGRWHEPQHPKVRDLLATWTDNPKARALMHRLGYAPDGNVLPPSDPPGLFILHPREAQE